jgi:hypothetical protein
MVLPRFDPARSIKFDLDRGHVSLEDKADRLLVPIDALLVLCSNAGEEAVRDFGRTLGTEAGRRAAARLGAADKAGLDAVVEHLGGDFALMGLGSLGIERWGHALVVTFDDSPLGAHGAALLAAIIEGALQRAFGRDASAVVLDRDQGRLRLLVVRAAGAERVRGWLREGTAWGEVLTRLHASGGRA